MDRQQYTQAQIEEIEQGHRSGIDTSYYENPKYMVNQMIEIRLGLQKGLDVTLYADNRFDFYQMREIRLGLEHQVDVSVYANDSYDNETMRAIRLALQNHINLIPYVKRGFRDHQLEEIELCLQENFHVKTLMTINMHQAQMHEIRLGLEDGLEASEYTTLMFSAREMRRRREILREKMRMAPKAPTSGEDVNGSVEWNNNELIICPILMVNQQVMEKTPELKFDGTIIVMDDMLQGRLEASKDIIIKQDFLGGELIAGRNAMLCGGVRCTSGGTIHAKKQILGDVFSGVELRAEGDVRVNGLLNTKVDTTGSVIVSGTLSEVVGCNIQAENGIEVYNLGKLSKIPTTVEIGLNENAKHRRAELRKLHFASVGEQKQLVESRQRIYDQIKQSGTADAKVELLLERLHEAILEKDHMVQDLEYNIKSIEGLKIRKSAPTIRVRGTAYAGC